MLTTKQPFTNKSSPLNTTAQGNITFLKPEDALKNQNILTQQDLIPDFSSLEEKKENYQQTLLDYFKQMVNESSYKEKRTQISVEQTWHFPDLIILFLENTVKQLKL